MAKGETLFANHCARPVFYAAEMQPAGCREPEKT
jgi:hypothetical protein